MGTLISSVGWSNSEVLHNIRSLHCPDGFSADFTFSTGRFYSDGLIGTPRQRFDISPRVDGVVRADVRDLPLQDGSVSSGIFDPPFIVSNDMRQKGTGLGRFGAFRKTKDLWDFYRDALVELHRVIAPKGILVFKCQDVVDTSSRNAFSHVTVHDMAVDVGFSAVDLFILLAKNRVTTPLRRQHHARKFHSYFWVFRNRKEVQARVA